jgi:tetratricopeptide (TPR) repeat protein
MNKKYTYLFLLLLFIAASAFVVLRYNHKLKNQYIAFYPLQERKGTSALAPEWVATKSKAENLIRIVRDDPANTKSAIALATLYVQEARVTGNNMYYDVAAMNYINDVLQREPVNFEALTLKSLIYLSQHHFADALEVAQKAQQVGPNNAFVYGLLVDGNVEMGVYEAAVQNAEKMVSLRPDIRSYSRISYLREIHGDNEGAIEAMQRAVKAGSVGDEPSSWARIQLARLYENEGDVKSAEMHYTIALDQRPGYAYALAGLGHIAMAQKDYSKAVALYLKADSAVNDYSMKEQLAVLYTLAGEKKKAKAMMQVVIEGMSQEAQKGEKDQNIGHYADKELAYAYLMVKDYDKALQHALAEYNRRPHNIDVNETVAWMYYKKGAPEKALIYINEALKTGSKNPALLCRAGLIFTQNGQKEKGKQFLGAALRKDPNMDIQLKEESLQVLQAL